MKTTPILAAVIAGSAAQFLLMNVAAEVLPRPRHSTAGPEREAYFGDLHLHTSYSFDAYLAFGAQVDPDRAYRFARGEPGEYLNQAVKRAGPPLDFLAVTDHAEFMGVLNELDDPNSSLSLSRIGKELRTRSPEAFKELQGWPSKAKPLQGVDFSAILSTAWQREIAAANRHYIPGKFTTFIAYEWTSSPGGAGLHRNVIFRGSDAPAPFTSADSVRPEDLWTFLENIRKHGYEALAIPHNSNWSNGLMFDLDDSWGKPMDGEYALRRASHEPLVEISQIKGQSESRPALSPNDEFADFELYDNWLGKVAANEPRGSYVRDALGRGMVIAQQTDGANPYKFGFVGGSDIHNGLSDSAENAYAGTLGAVDATKPATDPLQFAERLARNGRSQDVVAGLYQTGSGNLTGVWAEQNTRESIYSALRRKETFATSGTRLKFRLFAGWDYSSELMQHPKWVRVAYDRGVPMGADLPPIPKGKRHRAPIFLAWAVKDPDGANLDRVQIVKVWLENGRHSEKIYDIALSNGREVDPRTGKAPPVGNTVEPRTATYTNNIGAIELSGVWTDPQFDPDLYSVYYMRVIEIPTPRWSTILSAKRGIPLSDGVPATIQERGWSSPIWFRPRQAK